jgi:hypothetical protein
MKSYDDRMQVAVIESTARINEGVSFYTATEHYADAYNLSLPELQHAVTEFKKVAA